MARTCPPQHTRAVLLAAPRLALLLLVASAAACSRGPPAFVARSVPGGQLSQVGDTWVLRLSGGPEVRGRAAGELVGAQIRWLLPRYLRATLRSEQPRGYVLELVRELSLGLDAPEQQQLTALATSAGVDRDLLMLVNFAPEVFEGLGGCSALGLAPGHTDDGVLRLGRNLDWFGGEHLADLGLVVVEDLEPHQVVSFTWPGLIGVVSGINDAGLVAANLVVLRQNARPTRGRPVMFLIRELLQHEDTAHSAADRIEAAPRTAPQNYVLADARDVLVLETDAQRLRRRDAEGRAIAVANAFDEDRSTKPGARYAGLAEAAKRPHLSRAELQAALLHAAPGDLNVQALVFEPATRTVYGSTHARPAAAGPYWTLTLSQLLTPR